MLTGVLCSWGRYMTDADIVISGEGDSDNSDDDMAERRDKAGTVALTLTCYYTVTAADLDVAHLIVAFSQPWSYTDMQEQLAKIALTQPLPSELAAVLASHTASAPKPSLVPVDTIYCYRETLGLSLDGRDVDMLTISSCHGVEMQRETRIPGLFPDGDQARAHSFGTKPVVLVSARVHPGESPGSFVLNGLMELLMREVRAGKDPLGLPLLPCLLCQTCQD